MSASINSLLNNVPKLNTTNYHEWKFAISMVLWKAGCWDIVSGKKDRLKTRSDDGKWETAAEEGLTYIGLTIDLSQYAHIRDYEDGLAAWKALADIYEKNSRATRIYLRREFYTFNHDPTKPIMEYITGITTVTSRLQSIKVKLDQTEIVDVIIFNLHGEYSNIAGSLMASKEELTVADVTGALVDEEARRGYEYTIRTGRCSTHSIFGQIRKEVRPITIQTRN
jgi:hypothetical protein